MQFVFIHMYMTVIPRIEDFLDQKISVRENVLSKN